MSQLVDTSVLILRERHALVGEWFRARLAVDGVAICDLVAMEYLMGARTGAHFDALREALSSLPSVSIESEDWRRALEVQSALAHAMSGGQRSVRIPDLVIAAAGERAGMELVHYDEDYDRIATITGQHVSWVVPRGSA